MAILDEYRQYKSIRDEQDRVESTERETKEQLATSSIIEILQSSGCEILWQNGYVFEFLFDGRFYSICNQNDRIVGSSWIGGKPSEEEEEMFDTLLSIKIDNPSLYNEIVRQYDYKNIVIEGQLTSALNRLLDGKFEHDERKKQPIREVRAKPGEEPLWKKIWKVFF